MGLSPCPVRVGLWSTDLWSMTGQAGILQDERTYMYEPYIRSFKLPIYCSGCIYLVIHMIRLVFPSRQKNLIFYMHYVDGQLYWRRQNLNSSMKDSDQILVILSARDTYDIKEQSIT